MRIMLHLKIVVIVLLGLKWVECIGIGGYIGRYRFYHGSYRSGSRYASKYRSSRIFSSTQLRTALSAGTIYRASRWTRRRSYTSSGKLPTVCYNDKYETSENSSGIKTLGRFVCPLDESQSDDYTFCCKEEGQQHCCKFWDDAGRTVCVIFGITVTTLGIFVLIFCCFKNRKNIQEMEAQIKDKFKKRREFEKPPVRDNYGVIGQLPYPINPTCPPAFGMVPYPTTHPFLTQ